jgi:hypothetical protein
VNELSEEQEREIIESAPKGTWALLLAYSVLVLIVWAAFYFGRFLPAGPVN